MKRMVLVDDESGQLEILSGIILDLYPQFDVATFDSSVKALEYIRNNQVDVVLSDIRMPVMDGLELSEQIVKLKPDTVISIVSAYSDFEYARRAIDFGVTGYLIKPVSIVKLKELLDKVEHQLRSKAENLQHINDLNTQLESYKPVYIEKQLRDLVEGSYDEATRDLIKSVFSLNGYGLIAVGKFTVNSRMGAQPFDKSDFFTFCKTAAKNVFSDSTEVLTFLYDEKMMILVSIINSRDCLEPDSVKSGLEGFAVLVGSEYDVAARIAVSEITFPVLDNLHECFSQAMLTLDYTFLISSPVCLSYYDVKGLPCIGDNCLYDLENKVLDRFRASNLNGVKEQLEAFCRTYSYGSHIAASHKIREHFLHIALSAKKHTQNHSSEDIIDCMNKCGTFASLAAALSNYLESLIAFRQERSDAATRELIERIRSYMHENFKLDISLEILAEKFHFNPSYISILFKSYTNLGFKEYLIHIRIEEAKRLLRDTGLKVYEIAQKAGYNDVAYFVKLFKKEVGVSPNRYRARPF